MLHLLHTCKEQYIHKLYINNNMKIVSISPHGLTVRIVNCVNIMFIS